MVVLFWLEVYTDTYTITIELKIYSHKIYVSIL